MRVACLAESQLPPFMHPAVGRAWRGAATVLEEAGAQIVRVSPPGGYFELSRAASTIIAAQALTLHRAWIDDPMMPIADAVRARC